MFASAKKRIGNSSEKQPVADTKQQGNFLVTVVRASEKSGSIDELYTDGDSVFFGDLVDEVFVSDKSLGLSLIHI